MRRYCSGCGTKVKQGFIKGNKLLCGREKILKTLVDNKGNRYLDEVKTPECKW